MEIYIDDIKLEVVAGEKLLGVVIDSNLTWNLHIDYLNSRLCLPKRAKAYLTFACRKMLHNALIKPILEYCCTVWGNCAVGNLQVLRLQKRCARLILDAYTHENSVINKLFNKLDWLAIDDIIRIRKLCMLHKINQGHCPAYFNNYIGNCIGYITDTHNYNTRSISNNNITTPAFVFTITGQSNKQNPLPFKSFSGNAAKRNSAKINEASWKGKTLKVI